MRPADLCWAVRRAERLGIGADRALIAARILDEEAYLRALGAELGIAFEPFEGTNNVCRLESNDVLAAIPSGILPLSCGGHRTAAVAVAPSGLLSRALIELVRANPSKAACLRLTTTERMRRYVQRTQTAALLDAATNGLRAWWPLMSAQRSAARRISTALAIAGTILAVTILPSATMLSAAGYVLSTIFCAGIALRLSSLFNTPAAADPLVLSDKALPVYSIIAALYRETSSVRGLQAAIEALDYPHEKLDVIIAVEADDRDTCAALRTIRTRFPIHIAPVPPYGPRTKPKALNFALPFARGRYMVVYDAEDRPEPDQLRKAARAFHAGDEKLACVQARLCIDNTDDNWLTKYFSAEYAAHFDLVLPALARWRLPLPLGGSSNHFRTETLRKVGAWDPYNVTEDADLGVRMARFGFVADVIETTTFEEAPARAGAWLRQRSRWFKGWMQTWLVHMREPARLWRELGPYGFVAFHLVIGGSTLAALVHPLFIAWVCYSLLSSDADQPDLSVSEWLAATALAAGYASAAILGWVGLKRRNLMSSAWVLLLTPLQWLFLSAAAWRALSQLFTKPFAWEKTDHGLARTSRRARSRTDALMRLDAELHDAVRRAPLPTINGAVTETFAARRRPLAASA